MIEARWNPIGKVGSIHLVGVAKRSGVPSDNLGEWYRSEKWEDGLDRKSKPH